MGRDRLRIVVAVLLLAGTALFVIGSVIEHGEQGESAAHKEGGSESGEEPHVESGEEPHTDSAESSSTTSEEKLFGLDIENPVAVTAAAVATAGLATLILFVPASWPLALAILLGLAFAVLDVREALHQQDEGRTAIAAIAWILLAIHLGIVTVSAVSLNRSRGSRTAPT
jgi:hypothetical protein